MKLPQYKIVLLGDMSVGKTCITQRFAYDIYTPFAEPTIISAFQSKLF